MLIFVLVLVEPLAGSDGDDDFDGRPSLGRSADFGSEFGAKYAGFALFHEWSSSLSAPDLKVPVLTCMVVLLGRLLIS